MTAIANVASALGAANGSDSAIDRQIADVTRFDALPFTSSIEASRALFDHLLPGWHLHVGYGASGVFPYATAATATQLVLSEAPTVPLAILRATWSAFAGQDR